jgi:hypothetical protein
MKLFVEGKEAKTGGRMYDNGKYTAIVYQRGEMTELSIRRNDRKPIMDWRDMQWIKNQLLGPEIEAVQIFPAESRLMDTANQYYLWAFPAGYIIPFGFEHRTVSQNISLTVDSPSVQRPFVEHVRPADLAEQEAFQRQVIEENT